MTGALALIGTAVATAAVLSTWNRVRFGRQPGVFRCRLSRPTWARSGSDTPPTVPGRRWRPRRRRWRTARAAWVHDVLLLQPGILPLSVVPVVTAPAPDARIRPMPYTDIAGLGRRPVWLDLLLTDGRRLAVAVAAGDREALVGPFLAAAIPGLPHGPRQPER